MKRINWLPGALIGCLGDDILNVWLAKIDWMAGFIAVCLVVYLATKGNLAWFESACFEIRQGGLFSGDRLGCGDSELSLGDWL